jgi:hypothetical protein
LTFLSKDLLFREKKLFGPFKLGGKDAYFLGKMQEIYSFLGGKENGRA